MGNVRTQLLRSHLALALLMVLVMAGAVVNFARLGGAIDRILKDNYASVIAAQDMKETLERQDSAVTFFLTGNVREARAQYMENRVKFLRAYQVEANNITETGEKRLADLLNAGYADYDAKAQKVLASEPPQTKAQTDQYSRYYFETLKPEFLALKNRAQEILILNEEAIKRASDRAKNEAQRAIIISVGVTVGAFVLAIFFAVRGIRSALLPLHSLAMQAEEIGTRHWNRRIELHRTDEIGTLADAFNRMSEKLREAWALEEERLHRAERMSDAALESLYDPVIVTDGAGNVVHWNRAAEGLFGAEEHAVGRPVAQTVSDKRIIQAIDHAIHQEGISAAEGEAGFVTLQAGETERTYRLRATPMRDNDRLLGAVAVLEDITHLRELDRLKTEFIGVASHELRTPVTSLLLSVQLLEEGAVGELTPDQKEVIAAQRDDLQRLERMMRDLLDMTRLEAGVSPPRLETVTAQELIGGAVNAVASQAEAKGIALTQTASGELPPVRADRSQIQRVLINLINNAVRHTPVGGSVSVEAHPKEKFIAFQVKDTGAGIPPDYLKRIFERFVQVPGATGGGAGLGLSIAQTIIKAHGGILTAESEWGQGSTFTFTLPISEIQSNRDERNPDNGTHSGR